MWDLASDTFNEHVRCKRCGQIPNQMINHHMREDALRLGNALNKDMMEVHFQYLGQHVLDWLGRRYLEVERKYLETTVAHVDCGEIGWNGNRPEVSFGM
jgi:hypothetical protein